LEKEDFAKFLGEYLKRGRYELGMTQAEFAWKIDISEEGYSKIERGKSIPSALTLCTIHNKTGISMDYIFREFGKIVQEMKPEEE
jgi:transcriptional regulator with XRE-family HTH domain